MTLPLTPWILSHRFDPAARVIADRHYNRQKPGTPQFVPPGRCTVFRGHRMLWVTSWPFGQFVRHAWPGAWVCSAFRREVHRGHQASTLIRLAIAHTRHVVGGFPIVASRRGYPIVMVTFIDEAKTRAKQHPGACYRHAGFVEDGRTKGGLVALVLPLAALPEPLAPLEPAPELFA